MSGQSLDTGYALPEDFDDFWSQTLSEADAVPVDFQRSPTSFQPLDTHVVEMLSFRGSQTTLNGWIATPAGTDGPKPAFLWIPAYGRESHLPDAYSTREGFVSVSFNFHGHAAFHREEYRPERGYFSEGVDSPQTWIFRRMAQDCFVAMRVLASLPEIDSGRLAVAGLSQGGGMAIWVGAHSPVPKKVVADLPFLSAMGITLRKDIHRYPLKELVEYARGLPNGMEDVLNTVRYFDTAHQATRLGLPTLVSLGEKDPAVRPETVRVVFDAVASKAKRLVEYPSGHDWNPAMVEANRTFMLSPHP